MWPAAGPVSSAPTAVSTLAQRPMREMAYTFPYLGSIQQSSLSAFHNQALHWILGIQR